MLKIENIDAPGIHSVGNYREKFALVKFVLHKQTATFNKEDSFKIRIHGTVH